MSQHEDHAPTAPWVGALRSVIRARLGYEVPAHRMTREIVPFTLHRTEVAGWKEPETYVAALESGQAREEWNDLVEAVMVGETYFYRHPAQIEAIVGRLLSVHACHGRPVRIWSAGCANGEEPYTLAMRLREESIPYEFLASDVNEAALVRARAASGYSDRAVGHLPEHLRERWLVPSGSKRWRVKNAQDLRVSFTRHNLVAQAPIRPAAGSWDAVLCRNVILYFPPETGNRVVANLGRTLAEGGSLWLAPCDHVCIEGEEESLVWAHDNRERFLWRPRSGAVAGTKVEPRAPPRAAPSTVVQKKRAVGPEGIHRLLREGAIIAARDALEARTEARPEDGAAWVALAACRIAEHAFADALVALGRAAAGRPRPEGLEYFRGTALLKAGRLPEARTAFHAAVLDDPDDWASSYQIAALDRRAGRTLREEQMLERAAALMDVDPLRSPAFGTAAAIVNSVHLEPEQARRAVRERLADLARARRSGGRGM